MAQSKGLSKKHSALQKQHYASHPARLRRNKIMRLKRHIKRVARKISKRAKAGFLVKPDLQAIHALKQLEK